MVLSGRERLVLVRPLGRLLVMTVLVYQAQVKAAHVFEAAVAEADLSAEELELTTTLVRATSREAFDLGDYRDRYTERLGALVEAKIQGHEIATAPAEPELQVINLMEALRRSVAEVRAAAPENRKKSLASGRTRKNPGQQKKRA
jgi:DNA end-binding protein Ku